MFPNLLEATQEYWRKLDELEAAYQQGKISIDEVNKELSFLMAELGRKRRSAITLFLQSWQTWFNSQRELIFGLAVLVIISYFWFFREITTFLVL